MLYFSGVESSGSLSERSDEGDTMKELESRCRELEKELARRERVIVELEESLVEHWSRSKGVRSSAARAAAEVASARREADEIDLKFQKATQNLEDAKTACDEAQQRESDQRRKEARAQEKVQSLGDALKKRRDDSSLTDARRLAENNDKLRHRLNEARDRQRQAYKDADLEEQIATRAQTAADDAVSQATAAVTKLRDTILGQTTAKAFFI